MRNFFRSCSIAVAVCLLATVFACAAPLSSYSSPKSESLHPETREPPTGPVDRSNWYRTLIRRDVEGSDADSPGSLASTPTDHIARYGIMTQPTPPLMASQTGGMLLEPIGGSSPPTPSVTVGDSCFMTVRPPTEHGYHIAVLVLVSCTFVAAASTAFYLIYRPWRLNRRYNNGNWSTVNVFSPPETPKPKPRLSISLPGTDKAALKHKASTSTLSSISEEPANEPSSRPPSYTKGPISLPDSPALAQCWPLSPSSSHRTVAEGQQSSFLPLR